MMEGEEEEVQEEATRTEKTLVDGEASMDSE